MRSDMYGVIHERPRHKNYVKTSRPVREVDGESLEPMRQGMRQFHRIRWGGKEKVLNLKPLTRFLESRIGQPWDKVYSEMCVTLKRRDSVFSLEDCLNVELNTFMVDGQVAAYSRYGATRNAEHWADFYVHPKTNLLCRTQRQQMLVC